MTLPSRSKPDAGSPLRTVYIAPLVHSLSLEELEFSALSAICVDERGIIEWVEALDASLGMDEQPAALELLLAERNLLGDEGTNGLKIVWLKEGFLCPGLIDTHTHAPQYPNLGLGSDLQLLDWLERVTFPAEAKFGDLAYARGVYAQVVQRTLGAGTTTSCYYATIHEDATKLLADLCVEHGQRAFIGKCCMDRNCPSTYSETTEESIAATKSFLAHFPDPQPGSGSTSKSASQLPPLVQPILTPRFAVSCTPSLLSSLAELSASRIPSVPIQTHMAENPLECAWVKELFSPEAQGEEWGDTYAGVYEHYGLMGPGSILAHCVHLDDKQREIIKRTGAGVSHCPGSNLFLNSGAARVRELLDMGIKVGLGTDCSGGPSIGILSAMRSASHVSRFLSFPSSTNSSLDPPRPRPLYIPNLFYLATMGGATLCRLDSQIGNFSPGKEFDALWVRARSPGVFVQKADRVEDIFEKWVWGGDDRDIGAVWVRGRQVAGELLLGNDPAPSVGDLPIV